MNAIPQQFLEDWNRCFPTVRWAGRTTVATPWEKRAAPREYWTYLCAESGRLAVRQGAWRDQLAPGQQVILVPGRAFSLAALSTSTTIFTLDFNVLAAPTKVDPLPKLGLPAKVLPRKPAQARRLRNSLSAIPYGRRPCPREALAARPYADALLALYLDDGFAGNAFAPAISDMVPEWLARVREQLSDGKAIQAMTIARLVALSGFSRSHVSHEFRRRFGLSPLQYLMNLRMAFAVRKLGTEREATIASIARYCGFSSPARFAALFKKRFGTTPNAWRKAAGRTS